MTYTVYHGDCLEVLPTLSADSVDTIITDPPYGLEFMGKDWDHGVPGEHFWREALRVAKPGAMLLAFGGTRTHHRLMVAIEDAGWKIRDVIMWVYGNGFPKSHDISKAIDKAAGAEREVFGNGKGRTGQAAQPNGASFSDDNYQWPGKFDITAPATPAAQLWDGWGTALKPAWEPIIVAMKPTDGTFANNALAHGVAGLWVDGGRVGTKNTIRISNAGTNGDGWGMGKRAHLNGSSSGRWPANVIHDGSDEVTAGFPVSKSTGGQSSLGAFRNGDVYGKGRDERWKSDPGYGDTGSVARFFYCAKASRAERDAGLAEMQTSDVSIGDRRPSGSISQRIHADEGRPDTKGKNLHPTVKPIALARYLARLTKTPTGGVMLDMFAGSGSLGCGGLLEGRDVIVIEQEATYIPIIEARLKHWQTVARQEAGEVEPPGSQESGQLALWDLQR